MKSWAYSNNVPYVGFRYFNIYSERQGLGAFYTQVFQKWIHAINNGEEITMYGDGEQTLDLVHSSDAARANILALFNDKVKNEHFNVGTGIETSVNKLAEIIAGVLTGIHIEYLPERDIDNIRRRSTDIEKIRKGLGWSPKFNIKMGIEKTIQWYKNTL